MKMNNNCSVHLLSRTAQKSSDARRDEDRSEGVLGGTLERGPQEQRRRWRFLGSSPLNVREITVKRRTLA